MSESYDENYIRTCIKAWEKEIKKADPIKLSEDAIRRITNAGLVTPPMNDREKAEILRLSEKVCSEVVLNYRRAIQGSKTDFYRAFQILLINQLQPVTEIILRWTNQHENRLRKNKLD
jgi:hypothetical protein